MSMSIKMAVEMANKNYKKSRMYWVCAVDEIMRKPKLIDTIRGHLDN